MRRKAAWIRERATESQGDLRTERLRRAKELEGIADQLEKKFNTVRWCIIHDGTHEPDVEAVVGKDGVLTFCEFENRAVEA
jgi:hypothetical protein